MINCLPKFSILNLKPHKWNLGKPRSWWSWPPLLRICRSVFNIFQPSPDGPGHSYRVIMDPVAPWCSPRRPSDVARCHNRQGPANLANFSHNRTLSRGIDVGCACKCVVFTEYTIYVPYLYTIYIYHIYHTHHIISPKDLYEFMNGSISFPSWSQGQNYVQ